MLDWFSELSFLVQSLIVYGIVINGITFFSYGLDKMKSRGDGRRTPEKVLWLLTLLGGSPAALLAMHYFRHKTKKISFQAVVILIIALQITATIYLYNYLQTL